MLTLIAGLSSGAMRVRIRVLVPGVSRTPRLESVGVRIRMVHSLLDRAAVLRWLLSCVGAAFETRGGLCGC